MALPLAQALLRSLPPLRALPRSSLGDPPRDLSSRVFACSARRPADRAARAPLSKVHTRGERQAVTRTHALSYSANRPRLGCTYIRYAVYGERAARAGRSAGVVAAVARRRRGRARDCRAARVGGQHQGGGPPEGHLGSSDRDSHEPSHTSAIRVNGSRATGGATPSQTGHTAGMMSAPISAQAGIGRRLPP